MAAKIGRPKGSKNKPRPLNLAIAVRSAQELANFILQDAEYRVNLIARARAGTLNASIEQMLWHYILGKPTETINLLDDRRAKDVSHLTDEELNQELVLLRARGEKVLAKEGFN